MKLGRLFQFALIVAAVTILAVSASASTIEWNTNLSGTVFNAGLGYTLIDGGLGISVTSGSATATLVFTPNLDSVNMTPTGVDYGDFELQCTNCAGGITIPAFTFDLEIDDITDNATGYFDGTSTGGLVTWNGLLGVGGVGSSAVQLTWLPAQIGPGASTPGTVSFNFTYYTWPNSGKTIIVAPNSGTPAGDTTIQGTVNDSSIPEPATMAMVGGLFVGLAALARKRRRT
jgi:hypothetical protein